MKVVACESTSTYYPFAERQSQRASYDNKSEALHKKNGILYASQTLGGDAVTYHLL